MKTPGAKAKLKHALVHNESELTAMETRLETQFVLKLVTSKEEASWMLVEDRHSGIIWQIDIPFPGSTTPWIVQTFPLTPHMAREIAEWLLARTRDVSESR